METLTYISIGVGITSFFGAVVAKAYLIGYGRGYGDGKHCGFTEGLYRAAERAQRQAARQEYWVG